MDAYWKADVRIGGGDVIGERYAVMVSTRGCPHTCSFCTSPLVSGYKGYRMRENDEVVKEIRWLVDTYGITEVQFMDDNFNVSAPRAKKLMKRLGEEFPGVVFSATGGTEVNSLDDEMIDLMAQSRFYKVLLAIEAADQELQNALIDKKVKIHRVPEVVRKLRAKGIETRALFMIGFPGEKRASIQKTIDMARSLDVDDFYISIVTPMPGTPLYDECIEKGLFVEGFDINNIRFSTTSIRLPDTTGEELETIRRTVWHDAFEERRKRVNSTVTERHHRFTGTKEYETIGFKSLKKDEAQPAV
jgi:anaerobic magnesium-protoporphyrin IX monomethyl ester cyclase